MIRVGIIGVTGYTGMEISRLLSVHPGAELSYASSLESVGVPMARVLPGVPADPELVVEPFDPARAWDRAEFFFLCLPHGKSMEVAASLYERGARIVDLSADFRLSDPSQYETWYGEHTRLNLLVEAVYGMPEVYRDQIKGARLVANPGCYPTSIILGILPLLKAGLVRSEGIIADCKSGVTGAGREPRAHLHFPEVEGNFSAYSIAGTHRHTGEIEQELGRLAGGPVVVSFTPHLLPVSRGILSTIYARPSRELDEAVLHGVFLDAYRDEPFVRIQGPGEALPSLSIVRGTNLCAVAAKLDQRTGTVIVISCIDNLIKGAAGQALQNMNLMTGQEESAGLQGAPLHP